MSTVSLPCPGTPARNREGVRTFASASMGVSSGRLTPVGEEHSPPRAVDKRLDGDNDASLPRSMLRCFDQHADQDCFHHSRTASSLLIDTTSAHNHFADDTSIPSLIADTSTVDASRSFDNDHEGGALDVYQAYAFSPMRGDQRRSKPQSSPGAKETNSFFQDLTGPHVSPMAPFESTPRKVDPFVGATIYPNTLPRAQFHRHAPPSNNARKDSDSSGSPQSPTRISNSPVGRVSSPHITDDKQPDYQRCLSVSQSDDNAQLQERCETMSQEIANLRDALKQMTDPHAEHFLKSRTLPSNDATAVNPVWGPRSPALNGNRALYPGTGSPAGGWSGRHSPAMSDMKSCEGSPSMNYIGLSLINSIQAQLQAGMDGKCSSSDADHRARMIMSTADSAYFPTARSSPSRDSKPTPSTELSSGTNTTSGIRSSMAPFVSPISNSSRSRTSMMALPLAPPNLGVSPPTPETIAFPRGSQPPWLAPNGSHDVSARSHSAQTEIDFCRDNPLTETVGLHHAAARGQQVQHFPQHAFNQPMFSLHVKPRHSTLTSPSPYMPPPFFPEGAGAVTGIGGFTTSASSNSIGRARGIDAYTPPEVLVARALSGRSQEASIILQQQLKSGSTDRQSAVVRAITPHLLTLSEDKHGNFLVQQAIGVNSSVAWKLKESYARLALSQYGCHVIQRILDEPEPLKVAVVEELLSQNLLDTLTSRNSVHVWAKALEIKWSSDDFRKRVFQIINSAMRSHWAYTAMQETGSIVVQNLFESAQGHEKKDCIEEILERLPDCAANQWGVWVVQHIIEHGDDDSRKVAFQKLLSEAATLSMSQFGQKAIMTALKSRDAAFISGYLDLLCDGTNGSGSGGDGNGQSNNAGLCSLGRRSVLVDIASTPQGLQIMTQLLTTISRDDRERIIKAVRRNSVFLKGSKTGLKVHQMCERARAFTGY